MTCLWLFKFIAFFLMSFILSLYFVPYLIKKAFRWRILDSPGLRKIHNKLKPRIGGIPIFLAYALMLMSTEIFVPKIITLLVGSTLVFFLGLFDDIINIKAFPKLCIQILIAFLTVSSNWGFGMAIREIYILDNFSVNLGLLALPVSILWIIAVMNSFNLIDGLDGLAGGISILVLIVLAVSSLYFGHPKTTLICLMLIGSILGFLRFNFYPSRLFMGDAGSLLLGYNIAVLSIITVMNQPKPMSFMIPVLACGVPLYDTITSIMRRILRKQNIFFADGEHIHHKILKAGLSHKDTVIFLYLVSFFLSIGALLILFISENASLMYVATLIIILNFVLKSFKNKHSVKKV